MNAASHFGSGSFINLQQTPRVSLWACQTPPRQSSWQSPNSVHPGTLNYCCPADTGGRQLGRKEKEELDIISGKIFHTTIKSIWTKSHGQLHSSCGHLISLITFVHLNYFIPFDYSAHMVKVDQNATTSLY